MKRFLPASFLLVLTQLLSPFRVFADGTTPDPNTCRPTDFGCLPEDPVGFVQKIYSVGVSFLGIVSLIYLIIGGYHVLTSQGDPEKLRIGKSYIFYSLAGLLLGIFGFVFFEIVVGGLNLPGFGV